MTDVQKQKKNTSQLMGNGASDWQKTHGLGQVSGINSSSAVTSGMETS